MKLLLDAQESATFKKIQHGVMKETWLTMTHYYEDFDYDERKVVDALNHYNLVVIDNKDDVDVNNGNIFVASGNIEFTENPQ